MIRTINRSVETVGNPNTDYKYFNHINWKGIDDSKNYLNIDQETFEDCKNVYIDEEGLLKSRPSIKYNKYYNSTNAKIIKTWKFNNYVVNLQYLPKFNSYQLGVDINGKSYYNAAKENTNCLYFDNKVYIFTLFDNNIWYCDNTGFHKANNSIYLPTKYVYTNNIKSENEVESDNLLTTSHKLIYNYTNIDFIVNPTFVNEKVTLIVDGEKYVRQWVPGLEKVLFTYKTDVPQNVLYNGDYNIDVADNGNLLMSSVIVTTNEDGTTSKNWTITFSTNGKYFEYVQSPDFEFFGRPIISKDGSLAVIMGEDGPYAYSLTTDLPTDPTGKRFSTWTNLLTYHGLSYSHADALKQKQFDLLVNDYESFIYCYYEFDKCYVLYYLDSSSKSLVTRSIPLSSEVFINMPIIDAKISSNGYDYAILTTIRNVNNVDDTGYNRIYEKNDAQFLATNYNILDFKYIAFKNYLAINKNHLYSINHGVVNIVIDLIADKNTAKILANEDVITADAYYQKSDNYQSSIKLLDNNVDKIVTADKYIYLVSNNKLYGNVIGDDLITVERTVAGEVNPVNFSHSTELNELYASVDNKLYISSARFKDDQKLLYFPKLNEQKFNNKITNVHPVSSSQVAIFFENEIWYCDWTENGYEYHKSKLSTGLKDGSDVITSFDGSNIIFPSKQGLVYLGYQELVQSTDQTLTILSNQIDKRYEEFSKNPIKLYLYKNWVICYGFDTKFYLFDIRNQSWWKWEYEQNILNILLIDDDLVLCVDTEKNNTRKFDKSDLNYYDTVDINETKSLIDWYIRSQKLNLGTLNYHKNIISIAINNVEQNEYTEEVSYNLDIKNYRLNISNRYNESQNLVYKVNMLRTFVKRCNSRKVNEFQYTLSSDTGMNGSFKQIPLSIHSIIIKYTIAGQVR